MTSVLPRFRLVQKLTDKINRVARENLTGINVVHAFNAERYQNDKFDEPSTKMMETQLKNQRLMAAHPARDGAVHERPRRSSSTGSVRR